ncbi:hypothetical protein EVAR_16333_1 [Eumeta japonica]|uniref:Uncharacterized protein n=1 Tax=Eumeta variegata TaxID=151549 RepID=A0A4C1VE72_EUMVA|nr:hypothetical protein EVAR_16333_1 [Eumeta japonica]
MSIERKEGKEITFTSRGNVRSALSHNTIKQTGLGRGSAGRSEPALTKQGSCLTNRRCECCAFVWADPPKLPAPQPPAEQPESMIPVVLCKSGTRSRGPANASRITCSSLNRSKMCVIEDCEGIVLARRQRPHYRRPNAALSPLKEQRRMGRLF